MNLPDNPIFIQNHSLALSSCMYEATRAFWMLCQVTNGFAAPSASSASNDGRDLGTILFMREGAYPSNPQQRRMAIRKKGADMLVDAMMATGAQVIFECAGSRLNTIADIQINIEEDKMHYDAPVTRVKINGDQLLVETNTGKTPMQRGTAGGRLAPLPFPKPTQKKLSDLHNIILHNTALYRQEQLSKYFRYPVM